MISPKSSSTTTFAAAARATVGSWVLIAATALATFGTMAYAPDAGADQRGVTLFDEEGFRGRQQPVSRDLAYLGRRDEVGDDRTRSIRVDPGCRAVLYAEPDFRGRSVTIERDESSLRRTKVGLDNVSSLRVECRGSGSGYGSGGYGSGGHGSGGHGDEAYGSGWGGGPYDEGIYDDDGYFGYGDGALLFEDAGLRGRGMRVDRDIADLGRTPLGNDRLSSIKVARGCWVTLFRDAGFRGERIEVRRTIDHLGETRLGNDQASSIQVDCNRDPMDGHGFRGAVLYRDSGFRGRAEVFEDDDSDLGNNAIGNDRVSSVRVSPGCEVTLYRDSRFRGRSMVVDRDVASLERTTLGNDSVSSVRVFCGRGGGWGRPDRPGASTRPSRPGHGPGNDGYGNDGYGVTVFTDDGFRGNSESFDRDVSNMKRTRVGNDRISSIQIPRGCRVTLYSNAGFRGRSVTLSDDVSSLGSTPVGNDSVSSMKVDCGLRR